MTQFEEDMTAGSTRPTAPKPPLGAAFANVFSANIASSLGDGIARTAIPLLAVRITDDALLISGIAALAMLPWLFFAIPAGILIDRIDRRVALATANTVRAALAVTLVIVTATGSLTIWWLYAIIFIYGIFETVYDGAIRAVVPSILPKAQLPRANSLIEAGEQVMQSFVSGPATSLLFAVSALIPLGTNAVVYALAVVLALFLPAVASGRQYAAAHARTGGAKEGPWYKQFVDGFRFIMTSRLLKTLWLLSTLTGMAISFATASFVLYLIGQLGLPEEFFGIFMLTGAAGAIGASVITQQLKERFGTGPTVAAANLLAGLGVVMVGFIHNLWAIAIGWFVVSGSITVWNILIMSLRQSIIPGRLLGRVHGTWRTVLWGSMPLGSVLGGLVGRIDLTLPFIIGGGASVLIGLVWFGFLRRLPNPEDVDNGDEAALATPTDPTPTDPTVQD
ncbi:MAG TPA: MFS transporter [Terrimesophilobacter sp.]|nr:MFS transporter [Terrimesophilobacter sp.]HRP99913.1 MFS transporter [Terrimesophilobacter sp.]